MLNTRGEVWRTAIGALALTLVGGCSKLWTNRCADHECLFTQDEWTLVKSLSHISGQPPPDDPTNEFLPGADAWAAVHDGAALDDSLAVVELGWRLYYDRGLSGAFSSKDNLGRSVTKPPRAGACEGERVNIACADCHDPQRYGSDFTSVPPNVSNGAGWYDVNGQQTLNVAYFEKHHQYYWNGRTDSLWSQAAQVIASGVSMNGSIDNTFELLTEKYPALYSKAFGVEPDKQPPIRVHVNAAKAIAAYEWFLTSDHSSFDRYVAGESDLLSFSAKRGLKLFIGHAGCVNCHNTALFSDGEFHNIGIAQLGDHVPTVPVCSGPDAPSKCNCERNDAGDVGSKCLPAGAYAGLQTLNAKSDASTAVFRRCSCFDDQFAREHPDECAADAAEPNAIPSCDPGPPESKYLGAWRTPSLRDVAMTSPYMHDGSYATLADVVWHYDQSPAAEGMGTSELAPLNLSDQDRADLVAFLETLTGDPGPAALVRPPEDAGNGAYVLCPTDAGAAPAPGDASPGDAASFDGDGS